MRSDQSHRIRRSSGPRRAVALVAMAAAALAFGSTLPSTTALGGPGGSVRQGLERLVREDGYPAARGADGLTRNRAVAVTANSPAVGKAPADVHSVTGDTGPEPGLAPSGRGDGDGRGSLRPWSLLKQLGVSLLRSWF